MATFVIYVFAVRRFCFIFVKSNAGATISGAPMKIRTMKDRIRKIMELANLSQQEFAARLEMSPASLSSIFNGRTNPTNNHVQAIHRAFPVVNVSWLMFGEGDMFVPPAGQDGVNPLTGKPFGENENSAVSIPVDGSQGDASETDVKQGDALNGFPRSDGERQAAFSFFQDGGVVTAGGGSLAGDVVPGESKTVSDFAIREVRDGGRSTAAYGGRAGETRGGVARNQSYGYSGASHNLRPSYGVSEGYGGARGKSVSNVNIIDRPMRKIKEIRVFFDDGTYEAFVPSSK